LRHALLGGIGGGSRGHLLHEEGGDHHGEGQDVVRIADGKVVNPAEPRGVAEFDGAADHAVEGIDKG